MFVRAAVHEANTGSDSDFEQSWRFGDGSSRFLKCISRVFQASNTILLLSPLALNYPVPLKRKHSNCLTFTTLSARFLQTTGRQLSHAASNCYTKSITSR